MKGTAALVSTAIVSAGGWVAIHASLHSTLPSYKWLESSNGARGNDVAVPKQGISEETNASAYCAQHSPVETSSISASPIASNEVIEMTQLKSLCAAWNDKTPHHKYKAIKFNSCPFWLHEHGDDKPKQPGPKISIAKGNALVLVAGATSTKTSKYNQIEGRWRGKSTNFIRQFAQSIMRGVGNQLSQLYLMKYAAAILGVPVINACVDMDGPRDSRNGTIQSLLPEFDDVRKPPSNEKSQYRTLQDICKLGEDYQKFPHTCPDCLANVATSIRRDMRTVAHRWACENKGIELDEATIHVRCGDFIRGGWAEYGFLPYRAYTRLLPKTTKSIGIITSTFDKDECRSNDCATIANCKGMIMDLKSFLEETYPNATVAIRNGPEETLASTFARITLSRRTVCSPSTFCLYPAIATIGEGHFANTDLYPFVHEIAAQPESNIRVIEDDFLSTKRMRELNIANIENLARYLRRTSSEEVENR